MTIKRNRVVERLRRARRAAFYTDTRTGKLGKLDDDGSVNPDIGEGLEEPYVWVRIGGERTATQAVLLSGVSTRLPDAEVVCGELPGGGWEVWGLDARRAADTLGVYARSFSQTEVIPETQSTLVTEQRLMPGLIILSARTGLYVKVLPLQHDHGYFEGGDLLLTPTSTTGAKALHLITLDPVTNTLHATRGADLPSTYTIGDSTMTVVMQDAAQITTPAGHIRLGAVLVANGDTVVDVRSIISARQWLAALDGVHTLQTTDATPATLCSIPAAEASAFRVAACVIGARDDYSASASRAITITARRAIGGDVTLVGAVVYDDALQEDSAGTPAIVADVDVTTQSIRVRITGIAAETWNWRAQIKVVRV